MRALSRIFRKHPPNTRSAHLTVVSPRAPVIVSYRQSDGRDIAVGTAWAFRAAGVPVWHDDSDLPPGDTDRRLSEALACGLSGAVLVVTPEIAESRVVREIELPRLLELEKDEMFTLSVMSVVERAPGKLDYAAPDRLLQQPEGTLKRFKQEPAATARQRADVARAHGQRRVKALRKDIANAGGTMSVDVQTRVPPLSVGPDADLVLRLRPPLHGNRRPPYEALEDLQQFLADLPQLVSLSGASALQFRGGAHLSVAFALGATLPTPLMGRIEVLDTGEHAWVLTGQPPAPGDARLLEVEMTSTASSGAILVYVDLLAARSDGAFKDFRAANGASFKAAVHVRAAGGGNLDPAGAGALVGEVSHVIRTLADQHGTLEVHLFLRCPWPIALLLGRALNTLRVHLYEWEDGSDDHGGAARPRYLPSIIVRSGAGGSPIEHVYLTAIPAT